MDHKIKGDFRPNDYEYAQLSKHVYGTDKTKPVLDGSTFTTEYRTWSVILTKRTSDGYFGAVYRCDETKQFVIAHRGTNSLIDWVENFRGIVLNQHSAQKDAAFLLVQLIVEQIRVQKPDYTLSFTGHSLGAFLAELSVYFATVMLNFPNVHGVTFESPGSKQSMLSLGVKFADKENLIKNLDIISYVCYPNLINACNHHVGTVYAINVDVTKTLLTGPGGLTIPGLRLVSTHLMNGILNWLKMDIVENNPKCIRLYMAEWPKGYSQLRIFFKYAMFENGVLAVNKKDLIRISPLPKYLKNQNLKRSKEAEDFSGNSEKCTQINNYLTQQKKIIKLRFYGNFKVAEYFSYIYRLPLQHFSKPLQIFLRDFYEKLFVIICKRDKKIHEKVVEVLVESFMGFEMSEGLANTLLNYEIKLNKIEVEEIVTPKNNYYNVAILNMYDFRQQLSCWLEKTGFTVHDLINESLIYETVGTNRFRKIYDLPPTKSLHRCESF